MLPDYKCQQAALKLLAGSTGMIIRTADFSQKLISCRRGSVAIHIGILMTVLIGMAGLGTEIPFVIYKHRQLQNAADAAALGGAVAILRGYPASPATEAQAVAAALGFQSGTGGVTVTANVPPKSGSYTSTADAIEVIVSQPQTLKLGGLFFSSPLNLSARAVAVPASGGGNFCLLATDTGSATGATFSNGTAVVLTGCGLAVNATGSAALSVTGAAILTASSVSVSGQADISHGGIVTATNGVKVSQPAIPDPYAAVPMSASSGCDYTNFTLGWASGTQQMQPGRYCNGVSIGNGAIVSMATGIYYIKSGTFSVGGGTILTGSGVTIVLTQNTSGYATVAIGNGAAVTLSAPSSGNTAGILFFSDRNAPNSGVNSFGGGAAAIFTGALYFPTQQVVFSNGAGAAACTQLIAWHIQFSGGTAAAFNNNCSGTGVSPIGSSSPSILVE